VAAVLDRPWRARVEALAARIGDLLPPAPPAALLHGDLWGGNILVRGGQVAALIDPACYRGDAEVDLAMLCLFDQPPAAFWDAYGPLAEGGARGATSISSSRRSSTSACSVPATPAWSTASWNAAALDVCR
jgi:aminoglycoside phosphotransferase (APT) family kinase protein